LGWEVFTRVFVGCAGPWGKRCGFRVGEAANEPERGFGDRAPAAIDCQRVPSAGHLDDLGDALVVVWRS